MIKANTATKYNRAPRQPRTLIPLMKFHGPSRIDSQALKITAPTIVHYIDKPETTMRKTLPAMPGLSMFLALAKSQRAEMPPGCNRKRVLPARYEGCVVKFLFLVSLVLQPLIALANQGGERISPPPSSRMNPSDVADALFPGMKIPTDDLYYIRLMMRFSQPDMQIVITQRIGGKFEVKRYRLERGTTIRDAIKTTFKEIPNPTVADVAQRIHVREATLQVLDSMIKAWLTQLRALKVSPTLDTYVCVDFCPKFDLWFDTHQDSVHYKFVEASDSALRTAQGRLSQWMLKVRADLDQAPVIVPQPRRAKPLSHQ